MIEIKNLHKSYSIDSNVLHVLKGLNLNIPKGDFISIMGASGSGKSTLLNILGLLDTHDKGEYFLNGLPIEKLNENKATTLRNKFIGFVFQSFNLIPYKTALENVCLPLYYNGIKHKKRKKIALEYLDKVGLKNWASHLPNELSGGQKQRVAIARALVNNPRIILADEPTGALDSKTSNSIMKLLHNIHETEKITVVVITHEQDIAKQTHRIVSIKDGIITHDHRLNN